MSAEPCHVCRQAAWKYKCSQCHTTKCCSLACINRHKGPDGDCPKRPVAAVAAAAPAPPAAAAAAAAAPAASASASSSTAAASASAPPVAPAAAPAVAATSASSPSKPPAAAAAAAAAAESSSRLSDAQLQRVVSSDGIRAALTSSELRAIISAVDGAADRELALQQALASHSTHFAQFVNELLLTLHGGSDHYRTEDEQRHAAAYDAVAHHTNAVLRNPLPPNPAADPEAAAAVVMHTLSAAAAAVQTGTIH